MARTLRSGLLPLVLIIGLALAAPAWPRTVPAVPIDGLNVDGVLEPAWFTAIAADSFLQRDPNPGAPASLPTRVYVAYDAGALYFGFLCLDSAPDSVHGRVLRRDNQAGSDFVDVYLDTFHDRRNCYWFTLTAAGVQSDGTISNETDLESSWDGLWESAVGRTDSGWTAEVRIPFSSIRHDGARADGWGLNFARYIERRREGVFWEPVDAERNFRVSEMGTLTGLAGIASVRHVEFLPHAIGRWDAAPRREWASQNELENLGLFVKLVPHASWTADLTYQPDFAQVDVDDEVINLSDYPVFLEEKRPLFLEMLDLFNGAPIQQFYSRRITDPDYGGRITGRAGSFRTSLIAAQDRSAGDTLREVGVARALWNVGRTSTVGVTGTYLAQDRFHAGTGGFDARLRWGLRNRLTLAGTVVDRSGPDVQPWEGRVSVVQDAKLFLAGLVLDYRGRDYNINDLGWSQFSNLLAQELELQKSYFPQGGLWQSVSWTAQGFRRTLADGSLPGGGALAQLYGTTRGNWRLGAATEIGSYYRRNYWSASPTERDNFGAFLPEYHPYRITWGWIYSDERRSVEAGLEAQEGTFREGRRWSVEPSLTVEPLPNLDLHAEMNWQQLWGVAEYDRYRVNNFRLWQFRARYSPSLTVSLRGTVQLVERDRELLTNLLLAWNWSPGSWFYLVYDETRHHGPYAPDPLRDLNYLEPGDRTLRAKLTWFVSAPWPR